MSVAAAGPPIRRRTWIVAGIAALVAFIVPMSLVSWLDDPPPEVRVLETNNRLSTLIVDRDARVLVINTGDREGAGAFLGRIAQPWEPDPRTIVASSDDDAAIGLWEALQRLHPATIIVAGVPGADPLWAAIDAECSRRRIDLRYVSDRATLMTARLNLQIVGIPLEAKGGRGVVVQRDGVAVVIALDATPPTADGQVLIFHGNPSALTAELLVTSDDRPRESAHHELLVGDRRMVQLELDKDAIHVFGGVLRSPAAQ